MYLITFDTSFKYFNKRGEYSINSCFKDILKFNFFRCPYDSLLDDRQRLKFLNIFFAKDGFKKFISDPIGTVKEVYTEAKEAATDFIEETKKEVQKPKTEIKKEVKKPNTKLNRNKIRIFIYKFMTNLN